MSTTDRRELTDDLGILLRAAQQGWQANIWTALPAIVTSYDRTKQTCECLPTIQLRQNVGGVISWLDFPPLVDVPVVFPGGGGYILTFPIAEGDEVLVVFASRCIDAWFASGNKSNRQNELRMHDPSDGFAIPGPRSIPNVLPDLSTTEVQLRSNDGTAEVTIGAGSHVKVRGINVDVTATVQASITAPTINLNGNVIVSGLLTADDLKTTGTNGVHSYNVHQHGGVTNGGSSTSPPTPGT